MRFWIRYPLGMGIFVVAVLWGWVVYLATRSPARAGRAVAGVMAGPLCRMILVDVRVTGMEYLEGVGGCVIVANHQGHVDQPVLAHVYRHLDEPVILAKMSRIWSLGVFRRLFDITGNIVVGARPSPGDARVLRVARRAVARGAQVGIFPEGTRHSDGRLGPFKLGAFLLAVDSGVPVVPIVVSRFAPEFDPSNHHLEPHVARVRVLDPVRTDGLGRADVGALRDEVWARMKRVLDEDEDAQGAARGPEHP